jgi:hypothetical protein
MTRSLAALAVLLALAACASVQPRQTVASACALGEGTYACQVERYHEVSAP